MLRSLKAQRTKLNQKIEEQVKAGKILLKQSIQPEVAEDLQAQAETVATVLGKMQERYDNIHVKICEASEDRPDEEIEKDSEVMIDLMTDVDLLISELSALQSRLTRQSSVSSHGGTPGRLSAGTNSSFVGQAGQHSVRLPKLDFDKFSGDLLRFQEFWDSFEAAVDSNPILRPVEKLNYLRAYLVGEAKQSISGISTCDTNYEVAVEILKKRFGNKQASVDAHYMKLMNLSTAPNNVIRLRSLIDQIEKHLRCLAALGEDVEHRHFISMIMSKLPHEVIVRLEEGRLEEEDSSVALLRKKLQTLLQAQETAQRQQTSSRMIAEKPFYRSNHEKPRVGHNDYSGNRSFRPSTMESMVASERGPLRNSDRACLLCGGKHFNDECSRYKTAEARRTRLRGRCYICLSSSHKAQQCQSNKPCFHCKQNRKHNRCLCPIRFRGSSELSAVTTETDDADTIKGNKSADTRDEGRPQHTVLATGDRVLLQTAMVQVKNPKGPNLMNTRVLLDCASNRSYISSALAQKLQLRFSDEESFSVVTFGSEKPKTISTSVTQIQLLVKDQATRILDVNVVPKITGDISRAPVPFDESSFLWKNLPLADTLPTESESSSVEFLIGNDYYLDLITGQKIEVGPGLYLLGSTLGWLLTGRLENQKCSDNSVTMFVSSPMNSSVPALSSVTVLDPCVPLKPSFDDFWKLESIGIKDNPEIVDNDEALSQFNASIRMTEAGRYEVTWPWKIEVPDLPDNYQLSLGRFKSLMKKFQLNPDLRQKYSEIIAEQEAKGVIEKVTSDSTDGLLKHYIPHHPVVKWNKATTKVRIVYDASAKIRKTAKSLNECLLRGPLILEDLAGLLIRFRLSPIAICADIEKAFLQIGLQKPDRDVTRFFWLQDTSRPEIEKNLQIYRFCRVPFGVISSPFLLSATVRHHLQRSDTSVAKQICGNIYVDNVVTGVNCPEDAMQFYSEAKMIFSQASMNLREWTSNSQHFLSQLPKEDSVRENIVKVLGICWRRDMDVINISTQSSEKLFQAATKRQLLQSMASIFDPLGFFAPLTIKAKLLVRKLWEDNSEWDEKLSSEQQQRWRLIAEDLQKIEHFSIPRFIGYSQSDNSATFELLCFSDASMLAYSASVYLKVTSKTSSRVNLVFAKTRLAPSRKTSIPRMELLGVLIGVRATKFVESQIRVLVSNKTIWTDSQCVLHWLSSTKQLTVFVRNRIEEIKKATGFNYRYVDTNDNPADIATRGQITFDDLNSSSWWTGPGWLSKTADEWPVWSHDIVANEVHSENTKTLPIKPENSDVVALVDDGKYAESSYPFQINLVRFSSLMKLLRVTAWILRAIRKFKGSRFSDDCLSSKEIQNAKVLWDKAIQQVVFKDVNEAIDLQRKCNLKDQLNVNRDENGVLRCYGRFLNADLPLNAKSPKLLPRNNPYTELIIKFFHDKLFHAGVSHTLSQIRHEYWIPQGRSAVRKIINRCVRCRRLDGGPYRAPLMPPLPSSRVTPSTPFSFTGLDYLGPLNVKFSQGELKKTWICLFTCLSVRAIHLELVMDASAEQFILCLRRFIARRGKPKQIISDNASQFKLSKIVLDRAWGQAISSSDVHNYVSSQAISWKFITERAPWMGGFYERLVGSVKRALKKGIGRLCLSFDQLMTVVTEVEAIINSRPLIYVDNDIVQQRIICPNDFLCLNPHPGFAFNDIKDTGDDPDYTLNPDSADKLMATWKKGHRLLDEFWRVWKDYYLAALRERSDYRHKQQRVLHDVVPQVGDVVAIKEDGLSRGSWRLGRIAGLLPSSDGAVRSARVQLPSRSFVMRPVKLLYPIESSPSNSLSEERELSANGHANSIKVNEESSLSPPNIVPIDTAEEASSSAQQRFRQKPQRQAARDAQQVLQQLAENLQI